MELAKIIKYLDKKFNEKIAAEWDNVGLQHLEAKKTFNLDVDVKNIVVCLDVNLDVIDFAIKTKANLIISRHPLLFGDLTIARKNQEELIKLLVKNKIMVYSIHTNYDASPNQDLLNLLQKKFSIVKTKRIGLDNEGYYIKLKTEVSPKEFIKNFEELFATRLTQINKNFDLVNKIKEFNIATGSTGHLLIDKKFHDTYFVTGEIKWHELVYANDHKDSVLILGHYMENYFVNQVQQLIQENFSDLNVEKFDIENQIKNYA